MINRSKSKKLSLDPEDSIDNDLSSNASQGKFKPKRKNYGLLVFAFGSIVLFAAINYLSWDAASGSNDTGQSGMPSRPLRQGKQSDWPSKKHSDSYSSGHFSGQNSGEGRGKYSGKDLVKDSERNLGKDSRIDAGRDAWRDQPLENENVENVRKRLFEVVQPPVQLPMQPLVQDGNPKPPDYDPPPANSTHRRLLTYRRFGGRLNNQLFQFVTALQHAAVLKRTLVVPDERREVDWTGMMDPEFEIWDLDSLNEKYDIDWTTASSSNDKSISKETSWEYQTLEKCSLPHKEAAALLNGGPELWKEWDEKCPDVLNIGGNTGLLFCKRQHQFCGDEYAQRLAYDIYSHLRLSDRLMGLIPSRRSQSTNNDNSNTDNDFERYGELAVHSRRAGEGGFDWEMCIRGNGKTCHQHIENKHDRQRFCDMRTMKGNCAVWLDFSYQIKSRQYLKPEKEYKFILASDGTHDWNIDFEGQFITANNTDFLNYMEESAKLKYERNQKQILGTSHFARKKLKKQTDLSSMRGYIDRLTATLLDMFSLVDADYFIGAYYSTLSLFACFLRGLDRIYDSNMCWMLIHPESSHAIVPPEKDLVNIDDVTLLEKSDRNGGKVSARKETKSHDPNELPPALMSDIEHAFQRSNDGNFIAIDRYLIQYQKPGGYSKKYIAILGDGLLPLTLEHIPKAPKSNGKDDVLIRANFTCSMGDQLNSSATVLMMRGHESYHEHYYVRGEKYKSPFSTNGDRFRTVIILCDDLEFDSGLSRQPPLFLNSYDGKFHLRIGSSFARPMDKARSDASKKRERENPKTSLQLVHCLTPLYGLTDPRWLTEYLEYHRSIGVSHVHVYNVDLHSIPMQTVLQEYRRQNFVTRHDWSHKPSGGYTTRVTYEHAKWAAMTDCALRSRGVYDYALFTDIDEIPLGSTSNTQQQHKRHHTPTGHLSTALEKCHRAKTESNKIGCSFNSNTITSIYTTFTPEQEQQLEGELLLQRYNKAEAEPNCPSNCKCLEFETINGERVCKNMVRKYHAGRQKYIANVKDFSIAPRVFWTHALSRDYEEMDAVMEVLEDDVMHVRHYQGHWYVNNNLITSGNGGIVGVTEKEAPLPSEIMEHMKKRIENNHNLKNVYEEGWKVAKENGKPGLEWVTTVK